MKCLCVMFNINWRDYVTNHEIAARASRPEVKIAQHWQHIVEIAQHRQHTWLGHVLRMDGNRLPKMSLQAHAHDVRCRGRPRKSWVESVLEGSRLDLRTAFHIAQY